MPVVELVNPSGNSRHHMKGPRFIIGRANECQAVILNDSLISRHHCDILLHEGGYVLRDLKSRNGTRVGGKTIKAVKLRDGAVFQVGHSFVRFFQTEESAAAAKPVDHPAKHDAAGETAFGAEAVQAVTAEAANADAPAKPEAAEQESDEPVYDVAEVVQVVDEASQQAPDLMQLGRMGVDPGYGIEAISLQNARGQVVHEAGKEHDSSTNGLAHLQLMLLGALRCNASDIHVEPKQHDTSVRMRVDGTMLDVGRLAPDESKRFTGLIKVLCDIDITRKSAVQEGHFTSGVPGRTIDYRVSFSPAIHGQKIVLRVLDSAQSPQRLDDLDMPEVVSDTLARTADRTSGVLLVCGPTGSGKTTTLYAMLRGIDSGRRNVVTIEDPVEYELPGITHTAVDKEQGQGFADLLRASLRQDPDVIVVGEVRDEDTAITAMQAATTGHLVFSTIHANDTIGTILRLLDLGVESYLLASTLNVVVAQRLMRRLCDKCKKPAKLKDHHWEMLGIKAEDEKPTVYESNGCPTCFGIGYHGRLGVYEMLRVNDNFRDIIMTKPTLVEMRRSLEGSGSTTLRDHAIARVLAGQTSFDEADRIVSLG